MDHNRILDEKAVRSRLYPEIRNVFQCEEERHAWRALYHQSYDRPLLRIWDQYSGSEPIDGQGMKSRAPDMRLDTLQKRRSSLADHLVHKKWIPGPYISFTTSPTAIEDLVRMRVHKRGPQTLTAIDANKRIRNGLPVLDVRAEMESYDIPDPYGKGNQYYTDHYVCLWEVTEAEIVGHWKWDALEQNENWYENIIMPEFKKLTEPVLPAWLAEPHIINPTAGAIDDLLSNFNDLSIGHDDPGRSDPDFSDQDCSDPDCSHTNWEDECEDSYADEDFYYDTDDELEQAHIADDIIKLIEEN